MAFYTSNFDDYGEYNYYSTPNYSSSYEIVPFQDSISSNYESYGYDMVPYQDYTSSNYETSAYGIVPFQDSSFYSNNDFEYDPNAYNNVYDPYLASSEANYYAHNFHEPKLLEYNPIFYNTHKISPDTRFVISYSNAPFVDDTVFDDYDPTPYDGGYDIAQTYGKPLSPSDQICYPRSAPGLGGLPPVDSSYGSIPKPNGKTEKVPKKVSFKDPISETEPSSGANGGINVNEPNNVSFSIPISEKEQSNEGNNVNEPEKLAEFEGSNCDNEEMRGDYGNFGNEIYDKPIVQFQGTYGYGLEAFDLCEGLFGYWPCLDKKIRMECGNCEKVMSEDEQWKSAADYLFASPYTYGGYTTGNNQYQN